MKILFDYNGNLALESKWLWENEVISYNNYNVSVQRKKITVLQRSAPRQPAIIAYNPLSHNIKNKIDAKLKELGELPTVLSHPSTSENAPKPSFFEQYIKDDATALDFFTNHDNGKLKPEKIREFYLNAKILNAFRDLLTERTRWINAHGSGSLKRKSVFDTVLGDLKLLDR